MSDLFNRMKLPFAAALASVAAFLLWRRSVAGRRDAASQRANVGSIDAAQAARLREAVESGYVTTLAAFATHADEAEYEASDAEAQRNAEALQAVIADVRSQLAPQLASACDALAERVAAAQLQRMAFAINRKNHGLPDAAQVKAELDDREALKRDIEPLYEQVKAVLL